MVISENLKQLFSQKRLQQILLFLFILCLVLIAYSPALTVNYAFADDYYCLWNRLYQKNWLYTIVTEGILQARPLNGILVATLLSTCSSLSQYVFFHALTIVETAVLAYMSCKFMTYFGWTKIQSCFLALSFCALPAFQIVNGWAVVTFFVLSAIFALLSVQFAIEPKHSKSQKIGSQFSVKRMGLSFVFMLLAIIIYQPWAMFYWVAVAICFTSHTLTDKERYIYLARFIAVFFSVALADLLILKIAIACLKYLPVSPERTHLTTHIGQKINWFFTGPLVDALNFNHLMISNKLAAASGLFILLGLALHFYSKNKAQSFLNWLAALAFIPLSYLPNLAISESFYTYRTELGLSTLLLFYAYLSVRALLNMGNGRFSHGLTVVIILSSLFNLITANHHMNDFFVRPQLYELKLLKAQLYGELGKEKQDHPVYFERKDTTAPFNRHDEFGMPSFACPWVREPGTILLRGEINKELTN